ncbi:MAG: hypothetical protein LBE06_01205 [Azoarcus sp.]|jgi:hypothetical protein|nr:hypothetical protein [Azoarcus sp.]
MTIGKYLYFVDIHYGRRDHVTKNRIDRGEQNEIVSRVLLPLLNVETGDETVGAIRVTGNYTVTGKVARRRATLVLSNNDVQVAVIGICTHNRTAASLWRWLRANAKNPAALPIVECPAAPWVVLRRDADRKDMPNWIEQWAKTAGWALMRRKEWKCQQHSI